MKLRIPDDNDSFAFAPSGFLMFAPCKKPIEEVSTLPIVDDGIAMSYNLADALEFENKTWPTIALSKRNYGQCYPFIGNVKLKRSLGLK